MKFYLEGDATMRAFSMKATDAEVLADGLNQAATSCRRSSPSASVNEGADAEGEAALGGSGAPNVSAAWSLAWRSLVRNVWRTVERSWL